MSASPRGLTRAVVYDWLAKHGAATAAEVAEALVPGEGYAFRRQARVAVSRFLRLLEEDRWVRRVVGYGPKNIVWAVLRRRDA